MESACKSYEMLLSAYADGEVTAAERAQVELHLTGCADCRARLADLRMLSAIVSARMEQQADEVDFSGFAESVMRRITPERPGLLERMRVGWAEIMAYHRTAVISSLATAAITLLIAVPLAWKLASGPEPEVVLRELSLEDPNVQPVVMKMGDGRTLIMLVHRPDSESEDGQAAPPELDVEPPTGGEL